jgi:hypothetical protein
MLTEGLRAEQNDGDTVDYSGFRFDNHFCRRR